MESLRARDAELSRVEIGTGAIVHVYLSMRPYRRDLASAFVRYADSHDVKEVHTKGLGACSCGGRIGLQYRHGSGRIMNFIQRPMLRIEIPELCI